jgi:hypothetical protein
MAHNMPPNFIFMVYCFEVFKETSHDINILISMEKDMEYKIKYYIPFEQVTVATLIHLLLE